MARPHDQNVRIQKAKRAPSSFSATSPATLRRMSSRQRLRLVSAASSSSSEAMASSPGKGWSLPTSSSSSSSSAAAISVDDSNLVFASSSSGIGRRSSGYTLQNKVDQATALPALGAADDDNDDEDMQVDTGATRETLWETAEGVEGANTVRAPKTRNTIVGDKMFPLMKLPAEIRNTIYQACLTRPYNILLSKREPVPEPEPEPEPESEAEEEQTREFDAANSDLYPSSASENEEDDEGLAVPNDTTPPPNAAIIIARLATAGRTQRGRSGLQGWPRRNTRRFTRTQPSSTNINANSSAVSLTSARTLRSARRAFSNAQAATRLDSLRPSRPQDEDPLVVNILRLSKQVYNEARAIMYGENRFTLDLETAFPTLSALHQRSRRQIKHVELEIPCYNEILERFQETVRLSLRYCWGLRTFVIHMPFTLPGADGSGTTGNTTVYANGFDILRWLPKQCEVVLRGNVCAEIEAVVSKNANLAKTLDEVRLARVQMFGQHDMVRHFSLEEQLLLRTEEGRPDSRHCWPWASST